MTKEKNIKDKIFKIVLIIIIILLLIHNCTLLNKKGKDRTPSGNINIIEITCEGNNKCDEKNDSGKKNTNDATDKSNTNTTGGTNKTTTSDNSTANDNSTTDDNTTPSTNPDDDNNDDEPEDDNLKVFDKNVVWKDTTELKIFENSIYELEDIVAPESSNTYEFIVKNSTKYNLKYKISFKETNPYNINMKYKLKKNDTYIVDHYVSYDELNINEQILNASKNDTFYLEWKWISADNDNQAGENTAKYQLHIEVEAESI